MNTTLSLFEAFGSELEYMIVKEEDLSVLPVAHVLFENLGGKGCSDISRGHIDWSNELVDHVIELKNPIPGQIDSILEDAFQSSINELNNLLKPQGACLLPTGAHPFMDPLTQTRLWPGEYSEIYALYNSIFDCRGHGWSNLQSAHLNLPFQGDREFYMLHQSVRMLLPLLPVLSASTPLLDGSIQNWKDARLFHYMHNQKKIPSFSGDIIPEVCRSRIEYQSLILDPIGKDIAPYDPEGIMDPLFLNSRGAIARFDRGALEIRVLDIQESCGMDLAIHSLVSRILEQKSTPENAAHPGAVIPGRILRTILEETILHGKNAVIENLDFLRWWQCPVRRITAGELLNAITEPVLPCLSPQFRKRVDLIFSQGSLSERIKQALPKQPEREDIREVYTRLAGCLAGNIPFKP